MSEVALRKESVDRNLNYTNLSALSGFVALRKESVDRNDHALAQRQLRQWSLSARRAWIEIARKLHRRAARTVALRKESVDRNVVLVS